MADHTFAPTHPKNLKRLKSYITSLDTTLRHLGSVAGSEIHSLDASLSKISGRTPSAAKTKTLTGSSFETALYNLVMGKSASGSSSAYRLSKGQIWSDLASSVSRAIKRDL